MDPQGLIDRIRAAAGRAELPEPERLAEPFAAAAAVLEGLPPAKRPAGGDGRAGGLVELEELPCLVLPDLHARPEVPRRLAECRPPGFGANVVELLAAGAIQVVMLGDGPHSEGPAAAARWRAAWLECQAGWAPCPAMREEMTLAFDAMEAVALLVAAFPGAFVFLKGNHENIRNEEGGGNHPFGKYAYEGQMSRDWTLRFLGEAFLDAYAAFEAALPLAARGPAWLATHAEPAFALDPAAVVDGRRRPEVVRALTWTANDAADPGALEATLAAFLPPGGRPGVCLAGHRPVAQRFALRCGGRLVQIHDLARTQAALVRPGVAFDPTADLFDL